MNIIPIPCLQDNFAYLLICTQTRLAAVIDPSESEPILKELKNHNADLICILNTHHHWDHVGGNENILDEFPGIKVYAHASDRGRVPGQTEFLEDGDTIQFGHQNGRVIHNPGHTTGAITYLFGNMAFTGDTLFSGGCGRIFEGSVEDMHHSVNMKLGTLPDKTEIYFGHEYTENNLKFAQTMEPRNEVINNHLNKVRKIRSEGKWSTPSILSDERATNPFLRCTKEGIQETVRKKYPDSALDPVSVFSVIRKLKDQF